MTNYSFLASVYKNTKIDEMKISVASMVGQTLPPEQIVIVEDGPIPQELEEYISQLVSDNQELYTIVPLDENVGLGRALHEGMKHCRNELVARMDTDDYSALDRCAKQVAFMDEHPEYGVVGSNMSEFIGSVDNIVAHRNVPETHEEICEFLKSRCPFNHISVMLRKSEVEKADGYQHWHFNEDYYLWARMYLAGCKFYNIQEDLVFARVGENMYRRRGGYKYYKSERDLFKFMKQNKIIGWVAYQKAKFVRFVVQVLMPNSVRQWFFKKFARS